MKNLTKIIATILITTLATGVLGIVTIVNANNNYLKDSSPLETPPVESQNNPILIDPQEIVQGHIDDRSHTEIDISSTRDEFVRNKYTKFLRAPSKHFFLRQWFRQDNYKLRLDEASEEYLRLVFAKVLTNMGFYDYDVEDYSDMLFLEGHIVKAPVYEFIRAYSLYSSDWFVEGFTVDRSAVMTWICRDLDIIQEQHLANGEHVFMRMGDSYERNLNQLCEEGSITEAERDARLRYHFGW